MDLRTDSVNDVLKHYGISPGTGKTYIAGMLAHKLQFTTPAETRKKEQYEKQRKAELQLYNAKASQEKQLASLKPDKDNTHENRYKAMRATAKKLVREFDPDDAEFKKMYEDLNRRIKNWNELNQRINPGEMDKWGMLLSLYNRPFRSVYFDEYQ